MTETIPEKERNEAVKPKSTSPWAPFGYSAFTILWIATVISNIGTWMHDVGAGWLMTELSPSPAIVAAVQAATTLPIFLFALLAGAVADLVDRRRLLITVNLIMGTTAVLLTLVVAAGHMTPTLLLAFTFVMGTGAAFMAPAWQAIVPSLIDRSALSSAIALNSMGINISRAIGPALAGFLIVTVGLAAPFALNAMSFLIILAALMWWKPSAKKSDGLEREHIAGAILSGLRYARHSDPLKSTLLRALAFFLFASAYWALLPLIARTVLNGGPTLYGLLLASVGAGAVLGALVLPKIKGKLGIDGTVILGTLGTAATLAIFGLLTNPIAAMAASGLAGLSWIAVLASLNVSAQTSLPDWVRARGLSVFLTVFFGAMSLGSLVWGQLAERLGIQSTLLIAAIGLVVLIPLVRRSHLGQGESLDLAPSAHWPQPIRDPALAGEDGPVTTVLTYSVPETNQDAFIEAIYRLGEARKRLGVISWSVMQDAEVPTTYVERWTEASWIAHKRHHNRVSGEDKQIETEIRALIDEPYAVRHLLHKQKPTPKRKVS